jgi:polysaccharide export outer membrane protein
MHYFKTKRFLNRNLLSCLFLFIGISVFAQDPVIPTLPPGQSAPTPVTAPVTNSQAIEFFNQAKSAGMSDMDIERAALQNGYTLDDISAMRKRLSDKNAGANENKNQPKRDALDDTRSQENKDDLDDLDDLDEESNNPRDSTMASRIRIARLNRTFGASFFNKSTSTFEPNLRIATPKNYVLGPEDELIIDIYGNAVDNFKMKISPEGTVKMLNLAPVYVSGLTVEQAKERIVNRLRQAYSSLDRPGSGTYSTISLGSIRSIHVMITGEVKRPGTYTVSSLATAFNALYLSGGPNASGSYRNIEIIRDNKIIKTIDLYRFLVDADLRDNIALQDQDIILIRPYEKRIQLMGQLKKTGIFESKGSETFKDMIRYAGGFLPEASTSLINYQRNTGSNYVIGSLDSSQISTFIPHNGDIFTIKKILDVVANQTEIRGAVTIPGIYALEERCNTVMELITIAGGLSQRAFLNRAILERASGDTQTGIVSIDLRRLMNQEIPDIELLPGDILTIKSVEDLKEFTFLTINGSVISPGTYYYYKDITISDLIFKSGGYTEGGVPYRIEVSRRVKNDTLDLPANQNVRIFTLEVPDNLKMDSTASNFKLQPYDIVLVRKSPRYESQKAVFVEGEVMYPGKYTILNNFERISDLFPKVGGLKPEAFMQAARFYRNEEQVAVNLNAIIKDPKLASNLLLQNGDRLVIPRKSEIVRITGGVQNPSLVNFDSKFSFSDYISQAGGYKERAWKKRIYVTHQNGRTFRTKHVLFFKSMPKVEPGSVVTVPMKEPKVERQMSTGERIAIFSLLTSVVTTLTISILNASK